MQSIKQLTDSFSVCGFYEMSVYLSVCAVQSSVDDPPSVGCTCPYEHTRARVKEKAPRPESLPCTPDLYAREEYCAPLTYTHARSIVCEDQERPGGRWMTAPQ
jgi:hypothetical protein